MVGDIARPKADMAKGLEAVGWWSAENGGSSGGAGSGWSPPPTAGEAIPVARK